ncbi:MAG: T9SS type A sorting domain-containing protein [Bacteroidales bacterium]|nr:T9SS type A sorting domain-containing protein [Bacteroidales bacterium]
MKKRLPLILLLSFAFVYTSHAQIQHFTWQDKQREYLVTTPADHDGSLPVLFFLHGLGDNITVCDQEFNFAQLAEDFGWAIVVPQALTQGILGTMWNAGLLSSSIDDAGFLLALLDSLTVEYQLDPDSVFFTGFSMGGFMTYRMAIEHGDRITACAPVSGLISTADAAQTPTTPVRMLHIHGTNDIIVGYNGVSFGSTLGLGVDAILNYWQNANGCSGDPVIDTLPDRKVDGLRFIRYTYDCDTDLQHLKVVGGTHKWYHNADLYDVAYEDIIYEFFTGHNAPSRTPTREKTHMVIYPNPTAGVFNIQLFECDSPDIDIRVYDMYGKLVNVVKTMCTSSLQTVQIDLSCHPSGVYFVHEQSGAMAKVVVTH